MSQVLFPLLRVGSCRHCANVIWVFVACELLKIQLGVLQFVWLAGCREVEHHCTDYYCAGEYCNQDFFVNHFLSPLFSNFCFTNRANAARASVPPIIHENGWRLIMFVGIPAIITPKLNSMRFLEMHFGFLRNIIAEGLRSSTAAPHK